MARAKRDAKKPAEKRRPDSYWQATKTPIHSLIFLFPMIVFYEVGMIWFNRPDGAPIRNGADVILRRLLALLARPGVAASALVLVASLLLWQVLSKRPWRVRAGVLARMLPESLLVAGALYLYALLYPQIGLGTGGEGGMPLIGRLAKCFGDGIYEEFVYRLLLVGAMTLLFNKAMGLERKRAVWWAVGLAALIFAIAHYVGGYADTFRWYTFVFRFGAGLFFSVVLAFRGFGIAAAAHAFYDVAALLTR